jgi:hypothetical protein
MPARALGVTVAAVLVNAVPAFGQAAAPVVQASRPHVGWVSLRLTGVPGSTATVTESTPAGPLPAVATVVVPATGAATIDRAVPWRCDLSTRTFTAAFTAPGGALQTVGTSIRTPSCAARLGVLLKPRRPRARRATAIQVADRWGLGGLQARVCSAQPGGGRRRCSDLRLAQGQVRAAVRVRPVRAGRHPVTVTLAGSVTRRVLIVRPASLRLRVLATGDSMIQIVDGDLQRRLTGTGPITVRSDAHISTGISKRFMLDWVAHARATARGVRPDVTVMFLGANDGFPMGTPSGATAPCCDAAWVREYARRARKMMRSYARNGSGTVYWLLLPVPRSQSFARVFRPVNRALRSAARSFPGVVHLVDLARTFTPGGKFRQTMIWHGRRVSVRQADGVHLSVAGASIATELIVRRMRRDGLLG